MEKHNNKGITLIALVITIIVLLILASIGLVALSGENGILFRAGNARDDTLSADVKERVILDLLAWQIFNQDGSLTKEQLKEVLDKYFDGVPEIEDIPDNFSDLDTSGMTVKDEFGGPNIKVDISDVYYGKLKGTEQEEPPEFDQNKIEIGEAINEGNYGSLVKNYTATTEKYTLGKWRLFFQDENYTYLITDGLVGNAYSEYYLETEYQKKPEKYKNGLSVSTIGQRLNPMLLNAENGGFFTEDNENSNLLALAWLTDTDEWKDYAKDDALYAIGSPTIELFAKSYNATSKLKNRGRQIDLTLGTYGYKDITDTGWLDSSYNNGIYKTDNESFWWLASPDDSDPNKELGVMEENGHLYEGGVNFPGSVRPIVCFQTTVFNNKYELESQ